MKKPFLNAFFRLEVVIREEYYFFVFQVFGYFMSKYTNKAVNWKCTLVLELWTQLAEQGEHMLIMVSMCPSFSDGKWLYLLRLHDETSCCFFHSLCLCGVYECSLNSSQQTCRLFCAVPPLLIPDTHSNCLIVIVSFVVWNIYEIISISIGELFGCDKVFWGHTPQHLQPKLVFSVRF